MFTNDQLSIAIRERIAWRSRRPGIRMATFALLSALFIIFSSNKPVRSSESITIAAIYAETGIAALHNAPLIKMTELAVETINRKGGVLGKKVVLIIIDNNSTPIGAALAAQKAVHLNVSAVIGAHWSSHSLAMAPILQKAGIPMISPASTNPEVTLVGDFIFRVCFLDSLQGRAMAQFAIKDLSAKSAAIVVNIDEAYSRTLAEYFEEEFVAAGGSVLEVIQYRGDAIDFSRIINELKGLKPDVTFLPGYTRDSGLFIKQANKKGFFTTFLGGDAWDEISTLTGDSIDGSYQTIAWHPTLQNNKSRELEKLYTDKYGCELNNYSSPLAYDAVMILREAMEKCSCNRGEQLKNALYSLQDYQGVTGSITFNMNGDPASKEIMLVQFEKDTSVFVKTLHP